MQRASGTGDIQISTSLCVRSSQSAVVARTVAIAVLVEALLLAFAGAVVGAAVAYTVFNGTTISTLGGAVWDSQLVCSLNITPSLMVVAVVLACTLGLLGGLFPAIRAAHTKVADALHES
jgi:putative ABC transport system permease protein